MQRQDNNFYCHRRDPHSFWDDKAKDIVWFEKYHTVLDDSNSPFTKWFSGGKLNVCYNALDRHVENGKADTVALIHDSPVTNSVTKFTYKQMLEHVSSLAGVLQQHGVGKGDRVLIYMPMIPEAVMTMLACARLGAIHVVVFGGFAAKELSVRISHTQPKVIVSASAGIEPSGVIDYKPILDQAIQLAETKPNSCLIYRRPGIGEVQLKAGRDYDWSVEMEKARPLSHCTPVESMDPLYIIHTSGTTGFPKGVVRPSGGYAVVLPWSMRTIYGVGQGETWWAASDLGWVVGHSYACYAPLIYGVTALLYEGKPVDTPDAGQFYRLVAEHDVVSFFVAPTALRAIRQKDPEGVEARKYRIKSLRCIQSAGEHLDYETRLWAERQWKVPVLDHWWQTESGWPICSPCVGYTDADFNPPKDCSGSPVPGWDVRVVEENSGRPLDANQLGRIVVKLPLPPGVCSTFWQNDDGFKDTYFRSFPGFYDTADAGVCDCLGGVAVMSRVDDVINVAGHRISGGALEEAILEHPQVVDCAVIGVDDALKGTVPVAICVLRDDFTGVHGKVSEGVVQLVREQIGPVAALKTVIFVPKLPKTRSGKIARNTLARMAVSRPYEIPVTIEDATVYPVIKQAMQRAGLAKKPTSD